MAFPDPVNEVSARLVAAGVVATAVTTIALDQPWLTIPLAYGFVARVLAGPTFSPLAQVVTRVVTPRLGVAARWTPGPPKRFAQAMGAAFTLTAAVLALGFGARGAAYVVLAMLIGAASLEAFAGFCIGCRIFALLMKLGIDPRVRLRAVRERRHDAGVTHDSRSEGRSGLGHFEKTTFTADGTTRDVFRRGSGPAVIVMAEIPGITPKVVEFAERVVDIGCTAVLPHLFGTPGKDPNAGNRAAGLAYALSSMVPACINREFTVLATGKTSPVISWLRQLAKHEHERCGGPGVGAVGMCFTGGFALAMSTIPDVVAPVLSQPSLPFARNAETKSTIDISKGDLDLVKDRCAKDGLSVVGLRFKGDKLVPPERFEFLRRELGDAFVAVELDDESANPDAAMKPHSVLTEHLVDRPGEPTHDALQVVLEHLRGRLLVETT